jgi:hypothetical protein
MNMATEQEMNQESTGEIVPTDQPDSELGNILEDESPEIALARLEKAAELAPRWRDAMRTILMSLTYPGDWEIFGEGDKAKVCLGSAGAERVATQFSIRFFEVAYKKLELTDSIGPMYRYIYEGKATLGNRVVFAQGIYSTRDKFLGFAQGEYKTLEQINENDVQTAAYHRFMGNAIKALLGLRAMPLAQYQELMQRTGQDGKATSGHSYGAGTQGGTKTTDKQKQKALAEACIDIANAGKTVVCPEPGKCNLADRGEDEEGLTAIQVGKGICVALSSFKGKDGTVMGLPASQLKGKRLEIALDKATKLVKEMNK